MEIKSLEHTRFDKLAEAFGQAFAEYEVQITPEELRTMLRRRGFDPALSFAAFDDKEHILGFTLNGIGTFRGVSTAYDTGTGTLSEYRGQGLATQIFEASLPHLRKANVNQYLLEVLQHNTSAVSVYRRLGFEVSREFNYFRAAGSDIRVKTPDNSTYHIQQIEPSALHITASDFWDFEPSWQNSFEAIRRAPEDFIALSVLDGDHIVGYAISELAAGDITQIAVAKNYRRKGVGSQLLSEILRKNRATGIKCVNTEIGRDETIAGFLQAQNITLAGKQFEMIKKL